MCRFISIALHFFFTVAFAFFMLEGVYMYSILANVVTKNGMLSHAGNFCIGWGIGIVVISFSCSFEYEEYSGDYQLVISWCCNKNFNYFFYFSCWLQYDSNLLLAQLVPITVMVVASIMMVEAAGSVDESNMTRLDGKVAQFRFAIFMPY